MTESGAGTRARLAFAIGIAVVLVVLVAVLLLASSGGSTPAAAETAPSECLRRWNADDEALETGRHSRTFHRYEQAQVGYLATGGSELTISDDPAAGPCVVVFPRAELDPERAAAGYNDVGGSWVPLSEGFEPEALAALQAAAVADANATLTVEGTLGPL